MITRALGLTLLLLAALVAVPAAAQPLPIRVEPAAPTTEDSIDILIPVNCATMTAPVVTRHDTTIRIVLDGTNNCPHNPPILRDQRVSIGFLTAGEYFVDVLVRTDPGGRYASGQFTVHEAASQSARVEPFAISTDATDAKVDVDLTHEVSHRCMLAPCRYFIGGVEATVVSRQDDLITLSAPQLAAGLKDVVITNGSTVQLTLKNALYYFDRTQVPDFAIFERVLFPLLFTARGANGSEWVTEAAIANPRRWAIESFNSIQPIVCIRPPCGDRFEPRSKARWTGGDYPRGVALIVARKDADDLAFALRARDISRAAQGFGTEIPVVRDREMFTGTMTLLDVPLDPRYRVKLRVYSWLEGRGSVLVRPGVSLPIELRKPANCGTEAACAAIPGYAELDLAAGAANSRVNVYVTGPESTKSWAFATVTNNDTQQVTLVTPDGEGGVPCNPCTVPPR